MENIYKNGLGISPRIFNWIRHTFLQGEKRRPCKGKRKISLYQGKIDTDIVGDKKEVKQVRFIFPERSNVRFRQVNATHKSIH